MAASLPTSPASTTKHAQKIAKLLKLAGRAGTEGEATAALRQANALMAKYNLTRGQVAAADESAAYAIRKEMIIESGNRIAGWHRHLLITVCAHAQCVPVRHHRTERVNGKRVAVTTYYLVGEASDCETAVVLYGYLKAQIAHLGSMWTKANKEGRSAGNAYRLGMTQRVCELIEAMGRTNSGAEDGLVLASHKLARITRWMQKQGHATRTRSQGAASSDAAAKAAGHKAGNRVGLGDKGRMNAGQRALSA